MAVGVAGEHFAKKSHDSNLNDIRQPQAELADMCSTTNSVAERVGKVEKSAWTLEPRR